MAINLLRRVGHMISGVGGIVASLSPFRQSLDSSDEIDTGNQIPGLSNLQRSLGNTFVEEVSSASANVFDAEQFHGDVECDDNFANANSGHGRSSRKEYWDRVKGIECITSDLSAGCKCGLNCCHSMTIGTVLRCRSENAERTSAAQKDHASSRIAGFKRIKTVSCRNIKFPICL